MLTPSQHIGKKTCARRPLTHCTVAVGKPFVSGEPGLDKLNSILVIVGLYLFLLLLLSFVFLLFFILFYSYFILFEVLLG
jgi:hypothetical protein